MGFSLSYLVKGCKEIEGEVKKEGLKNIINQVWEGDSTAGKIKKEVTTAYKNQAKQIKIG